MCSVTSYVRAMEVRIGDVAVHYVEHGEGTPVLVLHGAGVDHREVEACFDPALDSHGGHRRVYRDLPGMGRTPAPLALRSADDVLDVLFGFADAVMGEDPILVLGHSAGACFAQGFAARTPTRVAGLALVCPLLAGVRDVPEHLPVIRADDFGDEEFRAYFVVQTPAMLERYERFVAPAIPLADATAMERIGQHWELTIPMGAPYEGPTLVVAGRQDSTVGYAAAVDLLDDYPQATLAVIDGAGHALPHEQPKVLAALLQEWLARTASAG
jgi:pimeloyl-ACP methyl ester carboxylesterase